TIRERLEIKKLEFHNWKSLAFLWLRTILSQPLFLFSRGKMTKELQSSRYIAISFLVREMGIDIVEAISLMAEFEKSGLVRLESSGDLTLKELGGAL
ncbi:MAG: hypothetical protein KHW51_03750, partial [Streptococcus parasanguinis]|nr:hypothetical protein [Streptococcus parasanguinis]